MTSLDLNRNHIYHNHRPSHDEHTFSNPFESHAAASSPQRPKPCVTTTGVTSTTAASSRNDRTSPGSYQASFASTGSSSLWTAATPLSSLDLEKVVLADDVPAGSAVKVVDLEKTAMSEHVGRTPSRPSRTSRQQHPASPTGSVVISLTYSEHEDETEMDDGRRLQESHALRILLFLAGPCVFLALLNTLWALVSIIITILTQPVRICARRPSFGLQLSGLLGPALNLQLRSIHTPLSPHANEDGMFNAGWLFLVHLLAPFVSFVTMFMAWVVAVYWFSSALVGDPAGMDKRDDGRETVLVLRKWWETFLLKAVQPDAYPPF